MTKLLEQAFDAATRLPDSEQEALGAWILHQLDAERRWQQAFSGSADLLGQLADEALAEHRDHQTQPLRLHRIARL